MIRRVSRLRRLREPAALLVVPSVHRVPPRARVADDPARAACRPDIAAWSGVYRRLSSQKQHRTRRDLRSKAR